MKNLPVTEDGALFLASYYHCEYCYRQARAYGLDIIEALYVCPIAREVLPNYDLDGISRRPLEELCFDVVIPSGEKFASGFAFSWIRSVIIPESVSYISEYEFDGCSRLKYVKIAYGALYIERAAFRDCISLETIDLPNSILAFYSDDYGKGAFSGCKSLKCLDIPDSVTTIDSCTFRDCSSLKTVDLPNSVTTIGSFAFSGCSSLKRIVLPPNLEKVNDIFGHCESLEFVKLPNGMTEIDENIFEDCPSLKEIVIDSKNPFFISQDSFLYNKEKSILYCFPPGKDTTEIFLPESLIEIKPRAFFNCKQLESVIFSPKSNCDIGRFSFYNCTSLRRVNLPYIKEIKEYTFYGCTSLEIVNVLSGLEIIGASAFLDCISIKSIDFIPDAIQIGKSAFVGCSSLETITLPNNLRVIGDCAFAGCTSLKNIFIPDCIHTLGDYIFYGDNNIEAIHIHSVELENVSIEPHAFDIDTKNDSLSDIFYSQCILYVPSGTRWKYRHHPVFGKFKNIEIEI